MSDLPKCPDDIHAHGEHIATIINLEPKRIEEIVKGAAKASGQRMDWHYVGGRAAVRMLGDIEKGTEALYVALAGEEERNYRFTTPQDSVIPMSFLRPNED